MISFRLIYAPIRLRHVGEDAASPLSLRGPPLTGEGRDRGTNAKKKTIIHSYL
jgi:hypothetical protein